MIDWWGIAPKTDPLKLGLCAQDPMNLGDTLGLFTFYINMLFGDSITLTSWKARCKLRVHGEYITIR